MNFDATVWRVNGRSIRYLNSPSVVHTVKSDPSWSYSLHTLRMPAKLEYNGSTVQCVLLDLDNHKRDKFSNVAILSVQGRCMYAFE